MKKYILLPALALSILYGFDDDPLKATVSLKGDLVNLSHCASLDTNKPLNIEDVVKIAVCNNPDAKIAYANRLHQAYQVGIAKSAYLPTLNATSSYTTNKGLQPINANTNQHSLNLVASMLLYDFGARDAVLEGANASLEAVMSSSNSTLQTVLFSSLKSFYDVFSAQALVDTTLQVKKYAQESLDVATAKYEIGTVTRVDKLQAQTAYSNAHLAYIKAQGDMKIAKASFANALGLPPMSDLSLVKSEIKIDDTNENNPSKLLDDALKNHPDIKAAMAQINASKAAVKQNIADGKPTISLSSTATHSDGSSFKTSNTASIGVYANFPIFTGFNNSYKIQSAKEQVKIKEAQLEKTAKQVALDVVIAHENPITKKESLMAVDSLVESAEASYKLSIGRYKAGVETVLDLLSSQTALANANEQKVKAQYDYLTAKLALIKSAGKLDLGKTK